MGMFRPVSFLFTYILRCGAEKLNGRSGTRENLGR